MSDIHKVRLTIEPDREIEVSGRELRNLRGQGLLVAPSPAPPSEDPPAAPPAAARKARTANTTNEKEA